MDIVASARKLDELFNSQRVAFLNDTAPSLAARLERVAQLRRMVIETREKFRAAIAEDFGTHHPWLVDLMETGPVVGRTKFIEASLESWLSGERIALGDEHGSSHGEILRLPKGVTGNISPWNFPVESSLVMVADKLAAGNRVIIKPSELAPATAQAVEDAVSQYFDPEVVAVVQGGPELAQKFADMPWDHLTFTGSPRVGRLVAQAAAKNLVPVTLELGGKNPALFASGSITEEFAHLFLSFRMMKSGQVCTSPDYAMVPADQMGEWIGLMRMAWDKAYPSYVGGDQCTGIINEAHYQRLTGYLDEARERGVQVVTLGDEEPDPARRQIAPALIIDPPADLACMTEEIFGPITPVIPYHSVDDSIAQINGGLTPLASYIVTQDEEQGRRFAMQVRSGGSAINNFGLQGGHPALPFGGLGNSGQGCHGAYEGFLNFSHSKSVFFGKQDSIVHQVVGIPLSELTGMAASGMYEAGAAE